MASRQLAHGQETLELQQSVHRQTPMRDGRMPPTESALFHKSTTLPTVIREVQMPPLESIHWPSTQPEAPTGFPIPESLVPTLDSPVSGAFKSTEPWCETGPARGNLVDDLFRPSPPPVPPRPNPGYYAPAPTVAAPPANPVSFSSAPPVVGACPPSAPSKYQHWKREVRLWMGPFPTATTPHLLAKITTVLPKPSKQDGMS